MLQDTFAVVEVHMGAELSYLRFYRLSRLTELPTPIGYPSDAAKSHVIYQSEPRYIYRAFSNVRTPPKPIPVVGTLPVLNWFTYSLTLNNPRVFSGTLYNYPDDGRTHTDFLALLYSSTHPAQGFFSRRMEYSFEEIQLYATLYIGGSLGRFTGYLGFNFGQAMYNFDLLENNVRISHIVNHVRPFSSQSVILGYRFGRLGAAWLPGNTLVYLEVITENTGVHPVRTELVRTAGGPPDPLYANTTYIRIGIRKTLQLVDDSEAQEPQEKVREFRRM